MGHSVEVNRETFETEVVQASDHTIVLVDFFAQWCGPCQMLKPVLEKLVQEYDFILAKVDIDQNPELANAYGIEGVPDVRIMVRGEMQAGFVGMLAEPKIRDLLMSLGLSSAIDKKLQQARVTALDDVEAATEQYFELVKRYPANIRVIAEAVRFFLDKNEFETAQGLLDGLPLQEPEMTPQFKALQSLLQFKQLCWEMASQTSLDRQFQHAACCVVNQDYDTALSEFLSIVECDRQYRNDGARKAMLAIFDLLGNDHPLTSHYRKQLMLQLY